MNERIKELSDKCGLAWTLKTEQDVKNLVEFAELIVKECANLLVKEAKSSHDEGSETYDTLIRESNWMKRYFGVTE